MAPPANAWPLTAATVGTGNDITRAHMRCMSATIAIGSAISGSWNAAPSHSRSRPFEKNFPVPVVTSAHGASGSAAAASTSSSTVSHAATEVGLKRFSPSFIVATKTSPALWSSTIRTTVDGADVCDLSG